MAVSENTASFVTKFVVSIKPFIDNRCMQYGLIDVEFSKRLPEICFSPNSSHQDKYHYELRNMFDAARPAIRFMSAPDIMQFQAAIMSLMQTDKQGMQPEPQQYRDMLVNRLKEQLNTLSFTLRKLRLTPMDATAEVYAQLDSDLYTLACSNYSIARFIEGNSPDNTAPLSSVRVAQHDYSQSSDEELQAAYQKHFDELFAIMQAERGHTFKNRQAAFTAIRGQITALETVILYQKMNAQDEV